MQKELANIPDMSPGQNESLVTLSISPGALAIGAVIAVIGVLIVWIIPHLAISCLFLHRRARITRLWAVVLCLLASSTKIYKITPFF